MSPSVHLVIATSGRAIAQGLKALDIPCVVVDGFSDVDTSVVADVCKKVKRTRYGLDESEIMQAVDELQREYSFNGLLYDAAIEANPNLLEELAIEPTFGNSCQTINDCINPAVFFATLDQYSLPYPEISFDKISHDQNLWLIKNQKSSGGLGVSALIDEGELSAGHYLQKKVHGTAISLTFLANGNDIYVLGFNTLWNEALNETMPYVYAGAINQVALSSDMLTSALQFAKVITKQFNLIGLNSIDYICDGHSVYVLEVNPRIPATYELYETKYGEVMAEHIEVCKSRTLPTEKRQVMLRAHAIVYAMHDLKIPENMSWPLWTADRPHDGELIHQYEPICSIFAGAKSSAQVSEMIKTRKKSIISKLIQ